MLLKCLEKWWKLEVFCEVSLEWDRFWLLVEAIPGFVEVFLREGSKKFEKIFRTGYFVNGF